jgi:hypothetical protein
MREERPLVNDIRIFEENPYDRCEDKREVPF